MQKDTSFGLMHFSLDFETQPRLAKCSNNNNGNDTGNLSVPDSREAGRLLGNQDKLFSSNSHKKRANPHAKKAPKYSTASSILKEVLDSRCDCNKNDSTKHSCFSSFSVVDAENIRMEWDYDYTNPSCPINENTMNQRLATYLRSHQVDASGTGTSLLLSLALAYW